MSSVHHYWNHDSIRPGVTGSVGDVIVVPRLRSSAPYLPIRFDQTFYKTQRENGSRITREPRTKDSNWGGKRNFKINHGWYYQDKRAPAKSTDPVLGSLGDYSWRNAVANVVEAKRTGDQFLPLPGGYKLPEGSVPRGGLFPQVGSIVGVRNDAADSLVTAAEANMSSVVQRTSNTGGQWNIPKVV